MRLSYLKDGFSEKIKIYLSDPNYKTKLKNYYADNYQNPVLQTVLRNVEIFDMYLRTDSTYVEIGKLYSISRTRTAQVIHQVMRAFIFKILK